MIIAPVTYTVHNGNKIIALSSSRVMPIKYTKSSDDIDFKNHILNDSLYPFFSIIIPTFNSERTLESTLSSLSVQHYTNFEIIIIDGASEDDTLRIIKEFSCKKNDISVKVISERDNGIYDAMNKGISISSGRYIYFLGSDDQLDNEKTLANISGFLTENPSVDILYGKVTFFDSSHSRGGTQKRKINYRLTFLKILNRIGRFLRFCIFHQAIFTKREHLSEGFSLKYRLASDFDWVLKQREKKRKFKYINEYIARYNVSGASSDPGLVFSEIVTIIKNHFCNIIFRNKNKRGF
jgi:glycosyltransferase involved in cell wall biosynthesis